MMKHTERKANDTPYAHDKLLPDMELVPIVINIWVGAIICKFVE